MQYTRKLALICVRDLRPLSLVEGAGFKDFIQTINPQYETPTRNTVKKYISLSYRLE